MAFEEEFFSETGFCRLEIDPEDWDDHGCADGPRVGRRLVLDGVNAVRVTFRCDAPENAQCFVIVNTVTDRNRDHLDAFRLEGMPGSRVHVLACALSADAILSYQFAIVDAGSIEPCTSVDRGEWMRLSQAAHPDCSNVRSLINGRGNVASLFVGPDASVVWPSESLRYLRMRAAREEDIGVRISTRRERERPRSIVVHDGECPARRTLILFDGEMWRANGVGWLTWRYPGLRVVTIDAGDLRARQEELTEAGRVEELVRDICAEVGAGPVALAGQSFGGLAVLEAACLGSLPVECFLAQSPSLWWGGDERGRGEGTLMTELRRGQRQLGDGLTVSCQVGERERAMLPVTRHCTALLERSGSLVSFESYPGGHDIAWWREGLVRMLDRWCT